MKFQHWLLSCLLLLASAAPMAHAAVSERDWKTPGTEGGDQVDRRNAVVDKRRALRRHKVGLNVVCQALAVVGNCDVFPACRKSSRLRLFSPSFAK